MARALALCEEVGLPGPIGTGWVRGLSADLRQKRCALTPVELKTVAEAALRAGSAELAYLASGAGLYAEDLSATTYLLLRARSLPPWAVLRRERCIAAVAELARRRHDQGLLSSAVETGRDLRVQLDGYGPGRHPTDPSDETLWLRVIGFERAHPSFPKDPDSDALEAQDYYCPCQCETCRIRRGERSLPGAGARGPTQLDWLGLDGDEDDDEDDWDEDADEDDWDEDADEDDASFFEGDGDDLNEDGASMLSPAIIGLIAEIVAKHGTLLTPEELERRDPELMIRLARALGLSAPPGAAPGSPGGQRRGSASRPQSAAGRGRSARRRQRRRR
jgi:hypothetical protein